MAFTLFIGVALGVLGCGPADDDDGTKDKKTDTITLSITSPEEGSSYAIGEDITIAGSVTSSAGLEGVYYRVGTSGSGTKIASSSPFSTTISFDTPGERLLQFFALDTKANMSLLVQRTVMITEGEDPGEGEQDVSIEITLTAPADLSEYEANEPVPVTGSVSGGEGDFEGLFYRVGTTGGTIKAAENTPFDTTITFTSAGAKTLQFFAKVGGKWSAPKEVNITITPPPVEGPNMLITYVFSSDFGWGDRTVFGEKWIELYNLKDEPQDLTGWSLQFKYDGMTGTRIENLSGTIPAGRFYLIATLGDQPHTNVTADLEIENLSVRWSWNGTSVALVKSTNAITGVDDPNVVDVMGFKAGDRTPSWYKGSYLDTSPTGSGGGESNFRRKSEGTQNTGDNSEDFDIINEGNAVPPRNSSYVANQVQAPTFDPASGEVFVGSGSVTIASATEGASVRYRFSEAGDWIDYVDGVDITENVTVYAQATKAEMIASAIVNASYTVKVLSPSIGAVWNDDTELYDVTITCDTPDAEILYSYDGGAPETPYTGVFQVGDGVTVKAVATKSNMVDSDLAEETTTVVSQVAALVFNPPSGAEFDETLNVTISNTTDGATIYTNYDGGDSWGVYAGGNITINDDTTIWAYANKDGMKATDVVSASYTKVPVAKPTFNPASGYVFTDGGMDNTVTIETITPSADIEYHTGDANWIGYTVPVEITTNTTLYAKAILGLDESDVSEATYSIRVQTPQINAVWNDVEDLYDVTITCGTADADIKYSIGGGDPDTDYTGAFEAEYGEVIKAVASKSGMVNSEIAEETLDGVEQVVAPEFDPPASPFEGSVDVTISTTTGGATIYTNYDGGETWGEYSGGNINITDTTTIYAYANKDGSKKSAVVSAKYTLAVEEELVFYGFDGNSPSPTRFAGGVTVGDMTFGGNASAAGTPWPVGNAPSGNPAMSGVGWNTTDNTASYFQFTVSANSGTLYLTTFEFDDQASATGAQDWVIRTSADGYSSIVSSGTAATAFSANPMKTVDMSSITGVASVTIRLYGYRAGGGGGATGTWRIDNVKLEGYIIND
jgi:hypothetical protein